MAAPSYDPKLVAAVRSAFADLDLRALTDDVINDRQVPEMQVVRSLDHFFGGVTDLHVLDEVDDGLPAPSTWDGSTYRPGSESGE